MNIYCKLFFLLPLFSIDNAAASLVLGAGVGASSSIYNNKEKIVYTPLPIINYDNDYFYIDSNKVGAYLYKNESQSITFIGSYDFQAFDPKDAVNSLSKISKRHSTIFTGLGYSLQTPVGLFTSEILQDTLGKSKGMKIDTSWSYPFVVGQWSIVPGTGVEWNNKKQNSYYYGVDKKESMESNVKQYDTKSSFTPYTSLALAYHFNDSWDAILSVDGHFVSQVQRKSPLTSDKSVLYSVSAAISYTF